VVVTRSNYLQEIWRANIGSDASRFLRSTASVSGLAWIQPVDGHQPKADCHIAIWICHLLSFS
jgi:hypothetical protein